MKAAFSAAESAPPKEQKVNGRPCARAAPIGRVPAAAVIAATDWRTVRLVSIVPLLLLAVIRLDRPRSRGRRRARRGHRSPGPPPLGARTRRHATTSPARKRA